MVKLQTDLDIAEESVDRQQLDDHLRKEAIPTFSSKPLDEKDRDEPSCRAPLGCTCRRLAPVASEFSSMQALKA